MKIMTKLILFTALIINVQACTSYEATLTMEKTVYPVSMNSLLYTNDLDEIGDEAYEKVGSFKFRRYMTGAFHGKLSLTKTEFDLSDDINNAIEEAGGNAMVNFRVKSTSNAIIATIVGGIGTVIMPTIGVVEAFNGEYGRAALITTLGAALPNLSKVVVQADIVRINDRYLADIPEYDTHKIIQDALSNALLEIHRAED